jgi:pimeloyl-ACP methyl ester carboxylesterase
MFETWRRAGVDVHALDRFGHDALHPVTSNWRHLRDELQRFVEHNVRSPAVLVGHSMGGLLSLMLAQHRPELAAGVVLLDSPVVAGWRALVLRAAKTSGLVRRVSPSRIARVRREQWPSAQAVREHFASKSVFARWDPRVLDAYVQAGFEQRGSHWALRFDRHIEAEIYDTLPHHLAPLLQQTPLTCPLAFIAGRDSAEMRQAGSDLSRVLAGERFVWTAGTHLFPMEYPDTTAAQVLELLQAMGLR